MKMKKIIIAAFVVLGLEAKAQQLAMFTEYMYNEVTLNPAYAGSHDVISATLLGRKQWVGSNFDGAPETFSFNVHGPLRNERIGVGFSLINDADKANKNLNAMGSISYILPFANSDLHFGLQIGAANSVRDYSNLDILNSGDPNLVPGGSGILPNFGVGVYYFAKQFYIGASAPQLKNNQLKVDGKPIDVVQKRHYFFNTGYVFEVSPVLKLKPTFFFKYVEAADPEFDFTGSAIIRDMFWIGAAYRTGFGKTISGGKNKDAASILLGLQATEQFKIGYSYDLTRSGLNTFTSGSHELVLNYRFSFDKGNIITPRYF
jgi:type IX secretion system PorP/SprF family membrane protein